jgi:hypothetical protein
VNDARRLFSRRLSIGGGYTPAHRYVGASHEARIVACEERDYGGDGSTRGGIFFEGKVRPTLEVVIADAPAHLRRKKKPDLGIALIDIENGKT